MHYDIDDLLDLPGKPGLHLPGDVVALADGEAAVDDDVQVGLDACADVARADVVDLENAAVGAGDVPYPAADLGGGSYVNELLEARPGNLNAACRMNIEPPRRPDDRETSRTGAGWLRSRQ